MMSYRGALEFAQPRFDPGSVGIEYQWGDLFDDYVLIMFRAFSTTRIYMRTQCREHSNPRNTVNASLHAAVPNSWQVNYPCM